MVVNDEADNPGNININYQCVEYYIDITNLRLDDYEADNPMQRLRMI